MNGKRLSVPEPGVRTIAHELAYKIAREQLAGISDIGQQCRKSGARHLPEENSAVIEHLNRSYKISIPDGEVSYTGSEEDVPMREKILVMDYFTRAGGTPLSGKTITYKELHDGINYYPTFAKRTIQPLVNFFGDKPEQLLKIAATMGGHKADFGDAAVTFDAFPPEGSIIFDSTISDYLTNDDIHTLCETIIWKLVRLLKTGGGTPG